MSFEENRKLHLEELSETQLAVEKAIGKIRAANIFDPAYLDNLRLAVFYKNGQAVLLENGKFKDAAEEIKVDDFMQGKRSDFAGILPKNEFFNYNRADLSDRQFINQLFFPEQMTYEEFIVHEIGHNIFDLEYKKRVGDYEKRDDLTDVSEEHREKIKKQLGPLIEEKFPGLDYNKFEFNRQQIAEIYAMVCQREFCQRTNENFEAHGNVFERVKTFLSDPKKAVAELNTKYQRNCSIEDFYKENHTLSFVVAPLLEQEYPDLNERLNIFWEK